MCPAGKERVKISIYGGLTLHGEVLVCTFMLHCSCCDCAAPAVHMLILKSYGHDPLRGIVCIVYLYVQVQLFQ